MMRVLYAYRYGIVGGVSTQLRLRRPALIEAGHECDLFFSQDNGLGSVLGDPSGIHFGSEVGLGRLVRKGRFDAVVVIDSPELLVPASGPMFRRNPVYLDVHTTTATGLAYLGDINPSQLAGVMVPTRYSAGLVKQRLPKDTPIEVVPNILNTDVFSPDPSPPDRTEERTRREFVWVGKLDHHKNWRLALVYAAMLRDLLGDVQLHVVGGYTAPADQAEAFFRLAYRLGISDRVNWLDRVENTSLARLYRQCAASGGAMLVTSRDESFGMAAAEALLCGCPLIANDLPVFREVFPDSPMIQRVDIWDPEQVAEAASRLDASVESDEVAAVNRQLSDRYGPRPFVQSFETLLSEQP